MVFSKKNASGTTTYYMTYKVIPTGKKKQEAVGRDKRQAVLAENKKKLDWNDFEQGLSNPVLTQGLNKPIQDHIDNFMTAVSQGQMGRKGRPGERHCQQMLAKVELLMFGMKVQTVRDMDKSTALNFLEKLEAGKVTDKNGDLVGGGRGGRHGRGVVAMSTNMRDEYCRVLKMFGKWLDEEGFGQNPFRTLKNICVQSRDRTFVRMAPTLAQVMEMAEAFPEMAICYYMMVTVGLRPVEMRRMIWKFAKLDCENPFMDIPGFYRKERITKNGKDAKLPLEPWVVEMLVKQREEQHANFDNALDWPMFPEMPDRKKAAPMIRKHAEHCGHPTTDEDGRVLDMYSLRSTAATILFRLKCPLDEVCERMRHSSIQITLDHYKKYTGDDSDRATVIPDPRIRDDEDGDAAVPVS